MGGNDIKNTALEFMFPHPRLSVTIFVNLPIGKNNTKTHRATTNPNSEELYSIWCFIRLFIYRKRVVGGELNIHEIPIFLCFPLF